MTQNWKLAWFILAIVAIVAISVIGWRATQHDHPQKACYKITGCN